MAHQGFEAVLVEGEVLFPAGVLGQPRPNQKGKTRTMSASVSWPGAFQRKHPAPHAPELLDTVTAIRSSVAPASRLALPTAASRYDDARGSTAGSVSRKSTER